MKVLGIFVMILMLICGRLMAADSVVTEKQALDLMDTTCAQIKSAKDAKEVFGKINAGEHPFKDKDNPELYVFIYSKDVDMLAHPDKNLVGKNFKGKPDAKGVMFRDKIVEGALKHGKGSVEYIYKKPATEGLFPKVAYYQMCQDYIVISGRYK